MAVDRFLDTNILIYAFASGDKRSARAEALLAEGGVIGVQVLNEFTSVARRKLGWDWPQYQAAIAVISELLGSARPLTPEIHSQALKLARGSALSFYACPYCRGGLRRGSRYCSPKTCRMVGNSAP